jgi:hypothetical protein
MQYTEVSLVCVVSSFLIALLTFCVFILLLQFAGTWKGSVQDSIDSSWHWDCRTIVGCSQAPQEWLSIPYGIGINKDAGNHIRRIVYREGTNSQGPERASHGAVE